MNSVRVAFAAAALISFSIPVSADEMPKRLTVRDALQVLQSLRGLDAHPVIIKKDGAENTVMMPWDFKNGALRLALARDVNILTALERAHDEARIVIVKEVLKNKPGATAIQPGSPEMEDFTHQYNDLVSRPALDVEGLVHIKASDLRLDTNEIPATVLAGLTPILDQ